MRAPSAPVPPLPYPGGSSSSEPYPPELATPRLTERMTPQQLLLGAGAVAVVGTGLAAFTVGTLPGVLAVGVLLLVTAALAVLAGYAGGPTTGEALAASAVASAAALVVVGAATAGDATVAGATLSGLVAVGTTALRLVSPQLRTWPVAAWGATQVTVLVLLLGAGPAGAGLAGVLVAMALVGLLIARLGDDVVARSALLAVLPWWGAGVVVAERTAWHGVQPAATLAAAAAVIAAGGLLLTVSRRVPDLPVPTAVIPVLAGLTAGGAVAGAALGGGPGWVLGAGFLGLGLTAVVAIAASRGPDWVPREAGLTAAVTLTGVSAIGLVREAHWGGLGLLLITAAAAAVLLSARSRESRPSAVPVSVGAAAAAVVLLTTEGPVSPAGVGVVLVAIAVAALAEAVRLTAVRLTAGRLSVSRTGDSPDERAAAPTATTGTVVGVLGVLVARTGVDWAVPAMLLAILGLALMAHGDLTRRRGTRVLGQVALVLAAWSAAAQWGWPAPESLTVPAALVLLAGNRRRLPHGASWAGWGPGLAVGVLPSLVLGVLHPTPVRQVSVLVAALVLALVGSARSARAPFVLGLLTVVVLTVGWVLDPDPTGWVGSLLVGGIALLGLGAWREQRIRHGRPALRRVRGFR